MRDAGMDDVWCKLANRGQFQAQDVWGAFGNGYSEYGLSYSYTDIKKQSYAA